MSYRNRKWMVSLQDDGNGRLEAMNGCYYIVDFDGGITKIKKFHNVANRIFKDEFIQSNS